MIANFLTCTPNTPTTTASRQAFVADLVLTIPESNVILAFSLLLAQIQTQQIDLAQPHQVDNHCLVDAT